MKLIIVPSEAEKTIDVSYASMDTGILVYDKRHGYFIGIVTARNSYGDYHIINTLGAIVIGKLSRTYFQSLQELITTFDYFTFYQL